MKTGTITYTNLSVLTGALIISVSLIGRADEPKKADQGKIQLMFVQTADDFKADGKRCEEWAMSGRQRCTPDRPVRIAGHRTMPAYMDEWKAGEGRTIRRQSVPNATFRSDELGRKR